MTHNPPTSQQLDAIQARIDAATPGPWRRPLNTRYKHTVTAPLPDDERGSYLDGIDPVTGEREQCTVATIPIWSNGKHSRQRGGRDLEYIAAMSPDVAAALVDEVRRLRALADRTRALALLEAANRYAKLADENEAYDGEQGDLDERARIQHETVRDVAAGLRHLADEVDPMVGSLARDGFGLDEIADILARPAVRPAVETGA